MNRQKTSKKTIIAVVITSLSASLCCITPVLAVIAGISGAASTFSWLDPFRPYLIGVTIVILVFAWYQKLKPRKKEDITCECETDEKPSFWQSSKFLAIVTVVASLLLSFPYYSGIFFLSGKTSTVIVQEHNVADIHLQIEGMTCTGCEHSVNAAINKLTGVIDVTSDHKTGIAKVKFDKSKVSIKQLSDVVEKDVGYKVLKTY